MAQGPVELRALEVEDPELKVVPGPDRRVAREVARQPLHVPGLGGLVVAAAPREVSETGRAGRRGLERLGLRQHLPGGCVLALIQSQISAQTQDLRAGRIVDQNPLFEAVQGQARRCKAMQAEVHVGLGEPRSRAFGRPRKGLVEGYVGPGVVVETPAESAALGV